MKISIFCLFLSLFVCLFYFVQAKREMSIVGDITRLEKENEKKALSVNNDLAYHAKGVVVSNATVVFIVWDNGSYNASVSKSWRESIPFLNNLLYTRVPTYLLPGARSTEPQAKYKYLDKDLHYLVPTNRKNSITNAEITAELTRWIGARYNASNPNGTIPSDQATPLNYVYVVLFPPGKTLSSGSCVKYCAFHDFFSVGRVKYAYAAVPWPGNCPKNCTIPQYTSNVVDGTSSPLYGALYSIIFHELIEILTDPYINAYYDRNGLENADKCIWNIPAACFSNSTGGVTRSYCLQPTWNHSPKTNARNSPDFGCTNQY